MSPNTELITSLLSWYFSVMLIYWYSSRRQDTEPKLIPEIPFALQEGQTILGVMDTADIICFCVGKIEEHVHEEGTIQ